MRSWFVLIIPLVIATPAVAQGANPALAALAVCRAETDSAARLACYDREAAALDTAVGSGRVVVMDQDQVRKTRRSLFGFTLPQIALFDSRKNESQTELEDGVTRLETTVTRASQIGRGAWVLELADGARWMQTDSRELNLEPQPGSAIIIRRAAMGSYLANIRGQTAIRVQRTR